MKSTVFSALCATFLSAVVATPSLGESTNTPPVIEFFPDRDVDVAGLPWIDDDTKAYIETLKADMTAGKIYGFVFAAAPDGNWGSRAFYPSYVETDQGDVVRQALEQCEFLYRLPCRILVIDGHPTERPGTGGWAEQPSMLSFEPSLFDWRTVPFISEKDRTILREYQDTLGPKAMALGLNGSWAWRPGNTIEAAMAEALTACQGTSEGQVCRLYALNNYVILSQDS